MLWLTAILPFLVVDDHTLRPGLPYAFPGVGLDRFDDGEFLRPPLSFRHQVILPPARPPFSAGPKGRLWNPCPSMEYFLYFRRKEFRSPLEKVGLRLWKNGTSSRKKLNSENTR